MKTNRNIGKQKEMLTSQDLEKKRHKMQFFIFLFDYS